ncbi:NUDIX hydrolase [Methylobacterium sp. BTF04]|uniref:NUDIX domain-containing protein n=1 Tax=Methylobacterium sp. BTF04 TaxID=2708300 RepID=UPI0013D30D67|nr:NUDIX hydrolase [Methylobacterium sp. BTF04]NEU14804.1 NUDIX hydrolase [Methylobacterium sp. BTF04]
MPKPTVIARQTAYAGYLTVETVRVRLQDGSEADREVESHGDAVSVLPFDPERRTALTVELFRLPVLDVTGQAALQEACAGMIEKGERPETTVRREAEEELGVKLSSLEPVARVWSSPGVSTERVSLFLAVYSEADRNGEGGGAKGEHEDITVRETDLLDLAEAADAGRIADVKLFALLCALRVRRPDLFVSASPRIW